MPLFIRRPQQAQIVEADQVGAGSQAHPQGTRPARPGDWIVTDHSTSEQKVLTQEEFAAQYEPMAIPQHLAPQPAPTQPDQGDEQTSQSAFPDRTSVDQPTFGPPFPFQAPDQPQPTDPNRGTGDRAPLDQPMTDQLPGRPSTSGEFRPRVESTSPVESPTGLPQQPGDADKAFHEREQVPDNDEGPEAPGENPTPARPSRRGQPPV